MADNNKEANTIRLSAEVGKLPSAMQPKPTQKLKLKKSISVRFQQETFAKKQNDIKESIPERIRSNSHMSFQDRPEFVPKPKPKPTKVNPSPMKLCKKNFLPRHKSNWNVIQNLRKDVLEIDKISNDSLSLSGDNNSLKLDEDDNDIEEEVTNVSKIRKELNLDDEDNLKPQCVDDYDDVLNIDALVQQGGKKKKSKSVWKKYIQQQDQERNWSHNSYCPETEKLRKTVSGGNFSIIKILESAANEKKSLHQSNFY